MAGNRQAYFELKPAINISSVDMSLAFLLTSFILAPGLRDTLNCGDYQLVVDGDMSARIISFRFKGTELLMQSDVHPFSYGSTLWYSPHTWNWPPPSALDGEPYMMTRKPNELVGTSREDQSIGLQFVKKFRFDLADSSLVLSYQVKNLGDSSIYA
ncbi:MAG: hypothetical protein KI790_15555, partial [Cyclobacteriaceae bacterium]|nr:hypothetical protein [Cyclobacteriaceae bacterium HetDA_MAG_MS6]